MERKRVCILSFSYIIRDGRVLRQIEYLAPHFDLTVIGYGESPGRGIDWLPIDRPLTRSDKIRAAVPLIPGRILSPFYDYSYWNQPPHRQAHEYIRSRQWDAFLADEWRAVPIAVAAARTNNAPVVYDAHEYSPLEREENLGWRLFFSPMVTYILKRYASQISGSMTVCQPIADRYKQEFGFDMRVVVNAPRPVNVSDHTIDPDHIHLVYHGNAQHNRGLDTLINAMVLADSRYDLTLMLVDHEHGYLDDLKKIATQVAPDRITFINPVLPSEIVATIAQFDVGLVLIGADNFSLKMTLPNKFFESVNAGLAVLISQSPVLMDFVKTYHFGEIAAAFDARSIADALNRLTIEDIIQMRAASRVAAKTLNADVQMAQVVTLFQDLLGSSARE